MSIKRQTLWSLAPLLVTAGVAFFSLPVFYNYLGDDMYALWNYIIGFTGMFGFADLGLGVAVGRYVSVALGKKDQAAVRGYWGTGNLILLPFLLLVMLVFMGLGVWAGPMWFDKLDPANVRLFRACVVVGGFGLFFGYYGTFWLVLSQAHLDFKFIGVVRVIMTLLQILPSIAIAWYTRNPLWLLVWSALISLLQLAVFVWHARRHYQLGLNLQSASRAHAREMVPYTGKMFLGLMAGSFFGNIDRTLLGNLAPAAAYSPYTFAGNVAQRLQGLSVSVMGPVLFNASRVADHGRAAAAKIYNDSFAFMFEWYLFAAIWLGLWHPVLLRLWLTHSPGGGGVEKGMATAGLVGPLLIPLVAGCCLTAMANISNSQLASLNRVGATVWFTLAAGLLAIAGIWVGWRTAGVVGAAYGFLCSRIAYVAQDLYTVRLIQAGGWLDPRTWMKTGAQGLVAVVFALPYGALPANSYWLLIAAALHGAFVAAWLLRRQWRPFLAAGRFFASATAKSRT
jgi:O-antigen/teichoic acid export membrane protein